MAHFYGLSPLEVNEWPLSWYSMAVSYMSSYVKHLNKKNTKGKTDGPPRKRRADMIAERKAGVGKNV